MKLIGTLVIILFLSCQFAMSQDTLYVYRAGLVVSKRAVSEIDSITFYKKYIPETVCDIDGNVYHTVKIGTQIWMVENLKTTIYNDGSPISLITDYSQWTNSLIGGYTWYNNDISNYKTPYGALYNWYAVNTGKLAPIGWHIPSQADINTLTVYLGGYSVAGSKLKESGNTHWYSANTDATNISGFTALPGGYRSCESGAFHNSGYWGVYWSSTEALANGGRFMMEDTSKVFDYNSDRKGCGFSVRCIKDSITLPIIVSLPTIVTVPVSAIMDTTAICGGNISADGGATISTRGVCWSTTTNPTIANTKTTVGSGIGAFTSLITGLTVNTTYYVRAYATNSVGTAYGNQVSFTTTQIVRDIDGNVYHSVTIGTQIWMLENIKTTKYRNGDIIGTTNSLYMDITNAISPEYQWAYNGSESNVPVYGRLYTWYTVADSRNIAPIGWHVASDAEWSVLQNYLIANGYNYDKTTINNKIAKSLCANTLWNTSTVVGTPGYDLTQNNSIGFSMVPGGYRGFDGNYYILGNSSDIWTSTENSTTLACQRGCGYNSINLGSVNLNKNYGFSVRCVKDTLALPVLTTTIPSTITDTSAISGGTISLDGGSTVTTRGICWSTTPNPTIENTKTTAGSGIGAFTSLITGITVNTTYYVRAYATNSFGTAYGNQVSFTTTQIVRDIDGNVYHATTIGTQTWLAEDLRTTRNNDGSPILKVTDKTTWAYLTTPGYCWYNNDSISNNVYGALYNWYAVNTGKLAPIGWHVATDAEWTTLTTYLGESVAGGKLKETGTLHWLTPNTGATNETNFNAVPGGNRGNNDGTFSAIGTGVFWWTATMQDNTYSYFRSLGYNQTALGRSGSQRVNGLYVRCVKN